MFKIKNYRIYPELYYDPEGHYWIKVEGNRTRIGLDDLVQETKGAFVAMQLDAPEKSLKKGDSFGTVEAEKHVGKLISPLSGIIVSVNKKVLENPGLANSDPYSEGWLIVIEAGNFEQEKSNLLTGEEDLRKWLIAEIKKFEEWGWLSES